MARRKSDGGVEECKGYSPPNDHTTSASSTLMPLGSWDLNTGTWSTETESFRSARMARSRQGTHQIRRRRRAARSLTSQGRAEPLCASTWSGERARFVGLFQGCTGLWTAGCWLARRLHQLKASTTMDLGISIFLIFVRCVALRNLELLIKTVGTYWSDLLLRTLVVGRRQQSESIEAALNME